MARDYVCLYHSYLDAVQALGDAERGRLFTAMLEYSITGATGHLPGNERFLFPMVKAQIDRDKAKYEKQCKKNAENGKTGGRPKKQKNPVGFSESEKSQGKGEGKGEGKGKDKGEGDGVYPLPPTSVAADVLADDLNRVNPSASQASLDELRGYAESMGADVCRRAIDIALDSKKATWPYIRAILRDKQARGVKCLADWDALEAEKEGKGNGSNQNTGTDAGGTFRGWRAKSALDDAD